MTKRYLKREVKKMSKSNLDYHIKNFLENNNDSEEKKEEGINIIKTVVFLTERPEADRWKQSRCYGMYHEFDKPKYLVEINSMVDTTCNCTRLINKEKVKLNYQNVTPLINKNLSNSRITKINEEIPEDLWQLWDFKISMYESMFSKNT